MPMSGVHIPALAEVGDTTARVGRGAATSSSSLLRGGSGGRDASCCFCR